MSMMIQKNNYEGSDYYVGLPASYGKENKRYPVVYLHDGDRLFPVLEELLQGKQNNDIEKFGEQIVVGVVPNNRNDEYTPWPAPVVKKNIPDFGGLGDDYLTFLATKLKPHIDSTYSTLPEPENTSMIGVSLGGLISLYSIYKCSCFGRIASISGSFWYPEFLAYIQKHVPCNLDTKVLLISGRNEGVGVPPPLQQSAEYLQKTHLILQQQLLHKDIPLIWDDGGHMDYVNQRFEKAFRWAVGM